MLAFEYFSILVDEVKDVNKKEQLNCIIRFTYNNLNIYEKALGCYHISLMQNH